MLQIRGMELLSIGLRIWCFLFGALVLWVLFRDPMDSRSGFIGGIILVITMFAVASGLA